MHIQLENFHNVSRIALTLRCRNSYGSFLDAGVMQFIHRLHKPRMTAPPNPKMRN